MVKVHAGRSQSNPDASFQCGLGIGQGYIGQALAPVAENPFQILAGCLQQSLHAGLQVVLGSRAGQFPHLIFLYPVMFNADHRQVEVGQVPAAQLPKNTTSASGS